MEQRAREYLAAGRFRKARDEIKPLVKLDRPKYLPLLIDANKGLAREMLAKGQVSEAQQVIAYLRTIASPAEVRALELEIFTKSKDSKSAQLKALPLLTDSALSLSEPEKRRLADHLVLTFLPVPLEGASKPQLAAEVQSIQAAIQAVSNNELERAQELIRPLPHSSILSHWKLFVKGLVAFYGGEMKRAARFFADLPPGSTPAKASQPYLLLAAPEQDKGLKAGLGMVTIEGAARLTGLSGLGHVLGRADQLWKEARYEASYKLVRQAVRGFPSENPGALGALSEFYFKAIFGLPRQDVAEYARLFEDLLFEERDLKLIERVLALRVFALVHERDFPLRGIQECWTDFLEAHERLHGPNPRLASLIYARVGTLAAAQCIHSSFEDEEGAGWRDCDMAIHALEKSVELDPSNLDSQLRLCGVYETTRKSRERNRLLDTMTQRFPQNKAVLVQAARACLDRQAYTKGLDYLQTASEVDRLDPAIPELVILAKVKIAQQDYAKKRVEKARQAFADLAQYRVGDSTNFRRAHWCLLAQEGLLEYLHGERVRAGQLLAQSRAASPAAVHFFFFARFAFFDLAPADAGTFPFAEELQAAAKEPNVAHAALLMQIYNYWRTLTDPMGLRGAEGFLRQYLPKAVKHSFTLAEARRLAEQFRAGTVFRKEYSGLTKAALKLDPKDPFFRLSGILIKPAPTMRTFGNPKPPASIPQLQSIIEEASRRGDEATAQLARQCLDRVNHPLPKPLLEPRPRWPEDGDAINEPGMPEDWMPDLSNASEAEIRELRNSLPKYFPREMFDVMLAQMRGGKRPSPEPSFVPKAPRVGKPEPPKTDPSQLEFF